jgi:hypothetical protein
VAGGIAAVIVDQAIAGESSAPNARIALPGTALDHAGIHLTSPTTALAASASLTASDATAAAARSVAGEPIATPTLEHMVDAATAPQIDKLAWVVQLDPAAAPADGGSQGSSPQPTAFNLVFIDATNGDFIMQLTGSAGA